MIRQKLGSEVGVVLSGGGVRGVAHIALLEALRERAIEPAYISGVSSGALVGALYAKGYSYHDMLEFFKGASLFRISYLSLFKPGLLNTDKFQKYLESFFPSDGFHFLKKHLYVTVTNVLRAKPETFSEGPLLKPLMASSALPPIFSPVEINDQLYIDGGMMNGFPAEPLLGKNLIVIGSSVNPAKPISKKGVNNTFKLMRRTGYLRVLADSQQKFDQCNYVFAPQDLRKFGAFDLGAVDRIFRHSYDAAKREMDKLMAAMQDFEVA